jgi:signal transduction histidine kinase
VVIADGLAAEGDPRLLRQALENLLANAWKFTGRSERTRIEVGNASVDGQASFFVRDNGVGFDMKYADRLFAPFQRFHSVKDFPGTGIGLSTVHRIVLRHGGRVWCESAPGAGTSLYFTLGQSQGRRA